MKTYGEWMYRSTLSWSRHYLEVRGQLHASAALPPGKSPRYPLDRRPSGTQSRSGQKLKFLTQPRLELRPLDRTARSQSLYRLRYRDSFQLIQNILLNSKPKNTVFKNWFYTDMEQVLNTCNCWDWEFLDYIKSANCMWLLTANLQHDPEEGCSGKMVFISWKVDSHR
jgi:hypothetical protein